MVANDFKIRPVTEQHIHTEIRRGSVNQNERNCAASIFSCATLQRC